MIRQDGKFRFYKIQHLQDDGRWVYSRYGTPKTNSKPKKGEGCLCDTFGACGYVWQQTGEHGVYDIRNARVGLANARKNVVKDVRKGELKKSLKLRLVLVEVTQKTNHVK